MRKFQNKVKYFYLIGMLLVNSNFAAADTKQMINNVLAKYGISAGGKKVCGTDEEPEYDINTGIVRCNKERSKADNTTYKPNNYWVPSERLCKPCPYGTILNKNTYQSCNQIQCQDGMQLVVPQNKTCPEGYELVKITNKKCPEGFELVELNERCPEGYERYKNQ